METGILIAIIMAAIVLVVGITIAVYCRCKQSSAVFVPPVMSRVPEGKTRIGVAGFTTCVPAAKAHFLADAIARRLPDKYETWYYFDQWTFHDFTSWYFATVAFPDHLKGHSTSPFCWLEDSKGKITPIGGSDHFSEWALQNIDDVECRELAQASWGFGKLVDGSGRDHHLKAPATAM